MNTKLRAWPDEDETVPMSEILEPLTRIANTWYIEHQRALEGAPYDGFGMNALSVVVSDPDFSADALERHAEDGRSPIDALLATAFHLGYEQACREEVRSLRSELDLLRRIVDALTEGEV